jgi:hypothetical protein
MSINPPRPGYEVPNYKLAVNRIRRECPPQSLAAFDDAVRAGRLRRYMKLKTQKVYETSVAEFNQWLASLQEEGQ